MHGIPVEKKTSYNSAAAVIFQQIPVARALSLQ